MDILFSILSYALSWSGIWFQEYEDQKKLNIQKWLFIIVFEIVLLVIQILAIINGSIQLYVIFLSIWFGLHLLPSLLLVLTSKNKAYRKSYFQAMNYIVILTLTSIPITLGYI